MEPKTLVDILVNLASLEESLQLTAGKLAQGRKRERMLTELQGEYVEDADEATEVHLNLDMSVRGGQAEIRVVEARIQDRKIKLVGLSDRRQVRALQEEISNLERTLDKLETRTLEEMDRETASSGEAESARLVSHWKGQESAREMEAIRTERRALAAAAGEHEAELERVVHLLPPSEMRTVLRLRSKLDLSVVHHHNGACTGCFHQLPAQQVIDVDRGRAVVRCPSCMRFIVHRPWV